MPIKFREQNKDSLAVLTNAAKAIQPAANPVMRTMGTVFPIDRLNQLAMQNGLPLYTVGLTTVTTANPPLNKIPQTGWIYLMDEEMSGIVRMDQAAQKHNFSSFTKSSLPKAVNKVLVQVNANASVKTGNFEIRLIHLPALYTYALWLKNDTETTDDDMIVPVLSDQTNITIAKLYTTIEFFNHLKKNALVVMAG